MRRSKALFDRYLCSRLWACDVYPHRNSQNHQRHRSGAKQTASFDQIFNFICSKRAALLRPLWKRAVEQTTMLHVHELTECFVAPPSACLSSNNPNHRRRKSTHVRQMREQKMKKQKNERKLHRSE